MCNSDYNADYLSRQQEVDILKAQFVELREYSDLDIARIRQQDEVISQLEKENEVLVAKLKDIQYIMDKRV